MGSMAIMGGGLLGLALSGMSGDSGSYSLASSVHSSMTPSLPEVPEIPSQPETADDGATVNTGMEDEREKERQQAALRRQQAQEVFTSGLGAAGLAETSKKSLLGG